MAYIRPKGDILVHISAASKILGICKETLRRWESKGMIVSFEEKSGRKLLFFHTKKVKSIEVTNKKISELLEAMSMTGFQGKKLSQIVDIWEHMINDKDVTIIMGYAGSLSTTGQWKIINWLIENHFILLILVIDYEKTQDASRTGETNSVVFSHNYVCNESLCLHQWYYCGHPKDSRDRHGNLRY